MLSIQFILHSESFLLPPLPFSHMYLVLIWMKMPPDHAWGSPLRYLEVPGHLPSLFPAALEYVTTFASHPTSVLSH